MEKDLLVELAQADLEQEEVLVAEQEAQAEQATVELAVPEQISLVE